MRQSLTIDALVERLKSKELTDRRTGQNMQYRVGYVDWAEVMRLVNQSLDFDPKDPTVHLWRGIHYHSLGFLDEATVDFDRCLELDPAYENCMNHRTMIFFNKGDSDAGMARFDEQLANARVRTPRWYRYMVPDLVRAGDRRAALLAAGPVLNNDNRAINAWIDALAHPEEDQSGRIDRLAAAMEEQNISFPIVWMTIGAYDYIEPEYYTHIGMWRADVKDFRQSGDFKRVTRDNGMDDYWRVNGFPPQCRALGEDDFECD